MNNFPGPAQTDSRASTGSDGVTPEQSGSTAGSDDRIVTPGDFETPSAPCKEVQVTVGGVAVTKTVRSDESAAWVAYTLRSSRPECIQFRLLDEVPEHSGDVEDGGVDPPGSSAKSIDITWWLPPSGELTIRRRVPPGSLGVLTNGSAPSIGVIPRLQVTECADTVPVSQVGRHGDGDRATSDSLLDGTTPSVLAAVPAYNEAESVADVVTAARRFADAVLVVDDGSTDETALRSWNAGAFVLQHESNRGYGATLQTIFQQAAAVDVDHLVVLDADGQHDPADIPKFVETQSETGAEIVIGNRFDDDATTTVPALRRVGISVINVLTNLGLHGLRSDRRISDTQSGFRCYSRQAVNSITDDTTVGERMEISTDILYHAHRHGYEIAEVGTTISYDTGQSPSADPLSHGYQLVRNVLPILERERPLLTLGLSGLILTLGGSTLLLSRAGGVAGSGAVERLTILASLTVALLGVLACMTGVMLHSLHRFHEFAS